MKVWQSVGTAFLSVALLAAVASGATKPAKGLGYRPQFRGPDRTGLSHEKGLLKTWPAEGPPLLWKAEGLGGGYTAPSVAGGRIFGMGYLGADEVAWAISEADGKPLWRTRIAVSNTSVGYPEGSRCTPTVDGENVYVEGVSGDVVCLHAADGTVVWKKNLATDFGGKVPNWGYTESPLVDGEKVIVTPGGKDATLVALNKLTGAVIWKGAVPEGDAAGYSSVIAADVDGRREYIAFLTGGIVGLTAADGHFLWRSNRPANSIVISTPIYHDHLVFASTAYSKGGALVKLTSTPGGAGSAGTVKAEEVYFNPDMQNHHGGVLLLGDYIYYSEGHNVAHLTCREFKTGKLMWADDNKTKCSLTYAEGNLYARSERGTMMLLEANPTKLVVKSSFEQPMRSGKNAWSHPVIAGGRLYLRDQDLLLCYNIRDTAKP